MGQGYTHLSEEERQVIQAGMGQGLSFRAIARQLGRSTSTITREVKRNTWFPSNECEAYRPYRPAGLKTGPWTGKYYGAGQAHKKARSRACQAKKQQRLADNRLWAWVADRLRRGWSPSLIAGRLRLEYPADSRMRVCAETIYAWIYATKERAYQWAQYLPRAHRRRRCKSGRRTARARRVGVISISKRPQKANTREQFGHWEGDSVICRGGNLHTQVERKTRFLLACKIPDKTKDAATLAMISMFSRLPDNARLSTTLDNGSEFAGHREVANMLKMDMYFAHPYSSFERGSNENRNGLLRRYLPKRTNITNLTSEELYDIITEINNRPMAMLGYHTPQEAFQQELNKHHQHTAQTTVALENRQRGAYCLGSAKIERA